MDHRKSMTGKSEMEIFNGTYDWDGKKHDGRDPIAWFPGSYNLRIFNLTISSGGVTHLKPYLCLFSETGYGHSISAKPGNFAKHVCRDFSLDLERVLWVEEFQEKEDRFEIIVFTRNGKLGDEPLYQPRRRLPTEGERTLIERELSGICS
jgi:hypothetical protein